VALTVADKHKLYSLVFFEKGLFYALKVAIKSGLTLALGHTLFFDALCFNDYQRFFVFLGLFNLCLTY
jgi:hypothetical protein